MRSRRAVNVHQTILWLWMRMTGQDAVNVAASFNEKIGIDGVIVTKLDGDTRGGAALSHQGGDRKTRYFMSAWARNFRIWSSFIRTEWRLRYIGNGRCADV